jgi:hypothetical protein
LHVLPLELFLRLIRYFYKGIKCLSFLKMGGFVKIKILNHKCLMLTSYGQFFQTNYSLGHWFSKIKQQK